MDLKKTFIIASTAILLVVLFITLFDLAFSGVIVAAWFFILLFGIATTYFFQNGSRGKNRLPSESKRNQNYFSGFNLILILVIVLGFVLLGRNLIVNSAFNMIHVSVVLYGTGLLIGNNYKGFEY
jgi:small-conductance mechanosensitive channel